MSWRNGPPRPRSCRVCGEDFSPPYDRARAQRCDTCVAAARDGKHIEPHHTRAYLEEAGPGWVGVYDTGRRRKLGYHTTRAILREGAHDARQARVLVDGETEPRWIAVERLEANAPDTDETRPLPQQAMRDAASRARVQSTAARKARAMEVWA